MNCKGAVDKITRRKTSLRRVNVYFSLGEVLVPKST